MPCSGPEIRRRRPSRSVRQLVPRRGRVRRPLVGPARRRRAPFSRWGSRLAGRRRGPSGPPGAGGSRPPEGLSTRRDPTNAELRWLVFEAQRFEGLAQQLGVRRGEALDVAQDAVELALEAWGTWPEAPEDQGSPEPEEVRRRQWLAGLLFRAAVQHRRRMRRESRALRPRGTEGVLPTATPSDEGPAAARLTLRSLQGETTPERWRAWVARYVDERPVIEIARSEGVPAATIYNRLRLAREDFAAALRREEARTAMPVRRAPGGRSRGR